MYKTKYLLYTSTYFIYIIFLFVMNFHSPELHSSISVSQRTSEAQFLYHGTDGAFCISSPQQPTIHYKSHISYV